MARLAQARTRRAARRGGRGRARPRPIQRRLRGPEQKEEEEQGGTGAYPWSAHGRGAHLFPRSFSQSCESFFKNCYYATCGCSLRRLETAPLNEDLSCRSEMGTILITKGNPIEKKERPLVAARPYHARKQIDDCGVGSGRSATLPRATGL